MGQRLVILCPIDHSHFGPRLKRIETFYHNIISFLGSVLSVSIKFSEIVLATEDETTQWCLGFHINKIPTCFIIVVC